MNPLATLVLRHRFIAALLASLAAAMPPLGLLGGAVTGLVTLRQGVASGLLVAGSGAAVAAVLSWLLGALPAAGVILVLASTVPVCLLALALRRFVSLNLTVQAGLIGACLLVVAFIWLVGDAVAFWRQLFELWMEQLQRQGMVLTPEERHALETGMPFEVMTGSAVANWLLFALGSVFLARSAQARLFNPGGFRKEFHGLRLGMAMLVATGLVLVVYAVTQSILVLNLLAVVSAGWLLQGLSVLHYLVALYQLSGWWLVLSYTTLVVAAIIANPLVLLFPLLGSLDQAVNLRRRLAANRVNFD